MLIHVTRTMAFGDALWAEPIVRYLCNQKHSVNVNTLYPEIFDNYPFPLKFNQKIPRKDFLINCLTKKIINLDMAYENRPKMHVLEAYRQAAGIRELPLTPPQLHLSEAEKTLKIQKPYVVIHLQPSPMNFRNVYGVNWQNVVNHLENKGYKVIQIAKDSSSLITEWFQTDSFRDVVSLLYNAKLFIGVDSGPSHIAAALGIPSVIFFGAVNPLFRHLDSDKKVFLQAPCEYASCYHAGKKSICHAHTCRLVGNSGIPKCCIQSDDQVIAAIEKLLKKN